MNIDPTLSKTTRFLNRIQDPSHSEPDLLVHPQLILTAAFARDNQGNRLYTDGAVRLYTIAKNVTEVGWVEERILREAAYSIGVQKNSFYRWLKDAKGFGLFEYVFTWDKKHVVKIISYKRAYELFSITQTDENAVVMPASELFATGKRVKGVRKGWTANVWKASVKTNWQDKTASRKTRFEFSGVPDATQGRLNKQAKIKAKRSIARTDYDATTDAVNGFKEFTDKKGIHSNQGKIAFCAPSKLHVSDTKIVPTGSRRQMRELGFKLVPETGKVNPRLFCETAVEVERAIANPTHYRDGIFVKEQETACFTIYHFDAGM